jgi:hypothetical protein
VTESDLARAMAASSASESYSPWPLTPTVSDRVSNALTLISLPPLSSSFPPSSVPVTVGSVSAGAASVPPVMVGVVMVGLVRVLLVRVWVPVRVVTVAGSRSNWLWVWVAAPATVSFARRASAGST